MDRSPAEGGDDNSAGLLSGALNASPFQPTSPPQQGNTETLTASLDLKAKPFLPPGGTAMSASSSAVNLNAAPFVPGSSAQGTSTSFGRSPSASSMTASSANAAPFVPGPPPPPTQPSPAQQQQQRSPSRSGPIAASDAPPFVPRGSPSRQPLGGSSRGSGAYLPIPPSSPARQALPQQLQSAAGGPGAHALPDDDDLLLGMTASHMLAGGSGASGGERGTALASQLAAQMSMADVQRKGAMATMYGAVLQQQRGKHGHPSTQLTQGPSSAAQLQHLHAAAMGGRGGGHSLGRGIPFSLDPSKAYSATGRGAMGGRGIGGRGVGRGRGVVDPRGAGTPGRAMVTSRFIGERLRAELQQRSLLMQAQVNPETDGDLGLPSKIHHYHTLFPLEDLALAEERPSMSLGVRSFVLKGVSATDGKAYALRWIDGRQVILTPEIVNSAHDAVERWSVLAHHPHLICPRQALATKEIEDTASLVFAYDYYPGAVTMEAVHMQPIATKNGLVRNACSEDQLWSYLVQIASALRAMHSTGLVARPGALVPSKVLLTSSGRLRIGSLGLQDILNDSSAMDPQRLQREDLTALGRLMLTMACSGGPHLPSLEYCASYFSSDFVAILRHLLSSAEGGTLGNGKQLVAVLGERAMIEMEAAHLQNDAVIHELSKECENGRLLRLLIKLGYINERPEGDMDPQWSETGDRYLLKLFRDFVFHQSTEDGAPVVDWGHVVETMNKLDAGVPEKILLLSRDEMSMLVASYSDIKRCVDVSFNELKSRANQARVNKSQQQQHQQRMHYG